ncbi:MAG: hypothetical protein IJ891_09320 [Prevotella sp.]|nr:hypothetical protein [Prevotella sp.]
MKKMLDVRIPAIAPTRCLCWVIGVGYWLISQNAFAQMPAALNKKEFAKHWVVESESADYRVTFRGDTADIVSPKGLTLWRKEKMKGRVTIEYDACVVVEEGNKEPTNRLSDLNCFWMASDPKYPDDIFRRTKERGGVFLNSYALRLYYMGYGGNHNSTTRFRRYDGDEAAITDAAQRPAILKEYTDEAHLLKPNHWYHIRLVSDGHQVAYYIDGKRLVDFRDAEPYKEGWFGFRTTLSHTRITNFHYTCESMQQQKAPLHWVGGQPTVARPVAFGVPFDEGEVKENTPMALTDASGNSVPTDTWPLAYWPDGSVKWLGAAATPHQLPRGGELFLAAQKGNKKTSREATLQIAETASGLRVTTDSLTAFIPKQGAFLMDSLLLQNRKVAERLRLVCTTQSEPYRETTRQISFSDYQSEIRSAIVERKGKVSAVVKIEGVHVPLLTLSPSLTGRGGVGPFPFVVRLYFYQGSREVKMVHSFVFDGDQNRDFIQALGVKMDVPLRDELYNRHVAFSTGNGGVWSEPVQPLDGRRELRLPHPQSGENRPPRPDESLPEDHRGQLTVQQQQMLGQRVPAYDAFDKANQKLIDDWAAWNTYRLSQPSSEGFTVRKRANDDNPWIGTFDGQRADGYAFVGNMTSGMGVAMKDFWQSYPSALEITGTKGDKATMTAWLWSPDAEPMDLRHYDNVAHGLNSSYEDVQEGMSTPVGIARTSTLILLPTGGYHGKQAFAADAQRMTNDALLLPTPEYLHQKQAFGVWSLPDTSNKERAQIEKQLDDYIDYYQKQIEQHHWYGFWNYGDMMHAYDAERHEWRYDVGGFAWDNTELASNMWLWYSFLRTGRADIWQMAEAMTRHTAEVDVYHTGPNAMLGSRHNVSHWGCGAKEARISQAAWNRFYYYLTTDERTGDLMTDVKDADQMLYTLDPMRLAQPRGEYPCTAPARLRIGPDWLAYAGNWMTEWERTRDNRYRDKIVAGMKSIAALPHQLFTGPLALGYDPATGVITTECDTSLLSTNHLMTIMGGFEMMNEMMRMIDVPEWNAAWLDHAARDKEMALKVRNNRFRISRLLAYAAYHQRDPKKADEAWSDMLRALGRESDQRYENRQLLPPEVPIPQDETQMISTNGVSTWSLDAIYMQEVCPMGD